MLKVSLGAESRLAKGHSKHGKCYAVEIRNHTVMCDVFTSEKSPNPATSVEDENG